MDELRFTAAAFFRGKGKNVVTEKEFVMTVSMDLRWVQPTDAERLLALLLGAGHLEKDGEYIRPAFDVHDTDVPIGFRPSPNIIGTRAAKKLPVPPEGGLLSELMARAESVGVKKKDFIVAVNTIQRRLNVDIEIAALLMLRDRDVDISEYYGRSYGTIAER